MSDPIPTEPVPVPDRARVDVPPGTKRLDALPILYVVGFLILASALIYLWRHPGMPRGAVQETARVETLQQDATTRRQQTEALAARVAALETRAPPPPPNLGPLEARISELEHRTPPAAPNLAPLEARIAALEGKPAPAPVDLGPIEGRVRALEGKPAPAPVDLGPLDARLRALEAKPPVDLGPLEARVAAAEKKQGDDAAAASRAFGAVVPRLDQTDARLGQVDARIAAADARSAAADARIGAAEAAGQTAAAGLAAITERAGRFGRLQAASGALEAGQRLGDIPGAPPALARFAHDNPPTDAALRLSFNQAAEAAVRASQPAIMDDKPLIDRMWTRAQQAVTVRQGDRVILGDPISGVIAHAKQALDAGDLAGAVRALDGLAGPAKAAMADWVGRAQSLLDARAALAEMAARG